MRAHNSPGLGVVVQEEGPVQRPPCHPPGGMGPLSSGPLAQALHSTLLVGWDNAGMAGWGAWPIDLPHSREGRVEAEQAAPIGTSCSPVFPQNQHKHSLEAPDSLSPRSPWAPTQDGAAEGVGRKCFAEKGLFYCNYLESESQGGRGKGTLELSGNMCGAGNLFGKKAKT